MMTGVEAITFALAAALAVCAIAFCWPSSCVSCNRPSIPMTPFIGVRISWLMVARNSDFALVAASSARFVLRRSSCSCVKNSVACSRK